MTPDEQEKKKTEMQEKNRGDLRHHSLDAMVIVCTLPWLAHRTHGARIYLADPVGGGWTKRNAVVLPTHCSPMRVKCMTWLKRKLKR